VIIDTAEPARGRTAWQKPSGCETRPSIGPLDSSPRRSARPEVIMPQARVGSPPSRCRASERVRGVMGARPPARVRPLSNHGRPPATPRRHGMSVRGDGGPVCFRSSQRGLPRKLLKVCVIGRRLAVTRSRPSGLPERAIVDTDWPLPPAAVTAARDGDRQFGRWFRLLVPAVAIAASHGDGPFDRCFRRLLLVAASARCVQPSR